MSALLASSRVLRTVVLAALIALTASTAGAVGEGPKTAVWPRQTDLNKQN